MKTLNTRPVIAKALLAVALLVVGAAVVAPFYVSRHQPFSSSREAISVISTHDMPSHLGVMAQFDKVLRSGVFYPRWLPDINKGYGIVTMNYYPPAFYYLTSLVNVLAGDWIDTLLIISVLSLAASGFSFYILSRLFYSKRASVFAALFYMLLPYHLLDLFWRGALPEYLGFVFLPLVVYFAYMLGTRGRLRDYAGFGMFYGLHLLTHLPVGVLFSYALGFFAIAWSLRERNWRIGARIGAAMAIGLLLSAIYWLPAALETRFAYEYATDLFPYHESYITLLDVGDRGSLTEFYRVLNSVFAFGVLALLVSVVVLRARGRNQSVDDERSRWTPLSMWTIMAIATTFMATSFSIYISRMLPKIQLAVPAFRWLAIAGMFTSLLVAATFDLLRRRSGPGPRALRICRIAFALIILLNLGVSIRSTIIKPLSNPTYHPAGGAGDIIESGLTPKGSTHPEDLPDTPLVIADPGSANVEVFKWDPQDREVHTKAAQPTTLRLKTYNFPGWTARIDGNVVPMLSDKDGVQQIQVPAGIHVVRASFENTPPRTAGTFLSGLGLLLILGLSIAGQLRQSRLEGEGVRQSAGPGSLIDSTTKRRNKISPKTLGLIGIVLIAGAAIVVITTMRSGSRNTGSPRGDSTDKHLLGGSLAPGSEIHLYLAGQTSVMIAMDEKTLDQVVTALSSRETTAADALVDSGRAIRVANNTLVRVIEIGTGKTRIRILEGEHVMVDGWVPERWLR